MSDLPPERGELRSQAPLTSETPGDDATGALRAAYVGLFRSKNRRPLIGLYELGIELGLPDQYLSSKRQAQDVDDPAGAWLQDATRMTAFASFFDRDQPDLIWQRFRSGDRDLRLAVLMCIMLAGRERPAAAAAVSLENNIEAGLSITSGTRDTEPISVEQQALISEWPEVRSSAPERVLAWCRLAARRVMAAAERSDDPVLSTILSAAGASSADDDLELETAPMTDTDEGGPWGAPASPLASENTIVHGTNAWNGDWWEPNRGEFHAFLRAESSRPPYSGNRFFSWSGALSTNQRAIAARRLNTWGGRRLQTVFAHSYGAEVVAVAAELGGRVNELVMLSAPLSPRVLSGIGHVGKVWDVRLKWDLILFLSCQPQHMRILPPNVTRIVVPGSVFGHADTHDPSVWKRNDLLRRLGMKVGIPVKANATL